MSEQQELSVNRPSEIENKEKLASSNTAAEKLAQAWESFRIAFTEEESASELDYPPLTLSIKAAENKTRENNKVNEEADLFIPQSPNIRSESVKKKLKPEQFKILLFMTNLYVDLKQMNKVSEKNTVEQNELQAKFDEIKKECEELTSHESDFSSYGNSTEGQKIDKNKLNAFIKEFNWRSLLYNFSQDMKDEDIKKELEKEINSNNVVKSYFDQIIKNKEILNKKKDSINAGIQNYTEGKEKNKEKINTLNNLKEALDSIVKKSLIDTSLRYLELDLTLQGIRDQDSIDNMRKKLEEFSSQTVVEILSTQSIVFSPEKVIDRLEKLCRAQYWFFEKLQNKSAFWNETAENFRLAVKTSYNTYNSSREEYIKTNEAILSKLSEICEKVEKGTKLINDEIDIFDKEIKKLETKRSSVEDNLKDHEQKKELASSEIKNLVNVGLQGFNKDFRISPRVIRRVKKLFENLSSLTQESDYWTKKTTGYKSRPTGIKAIHDLTNAALGKIKEGSSEEKKNVFSTLSRQMKEELDKRTEKDEEYTKRRNSFYFFNYRHQETHVFYQNIYSLVEPLSKDENWKNFILEPFLKKFDNFLEENKKCIKLQKEENQLRV